ncbi:glutathione S-transferase C-terminal domain-containing protein [Comamonas endophytica]|uniref:glutathione S-transferase C-terminal domain-containing protein n=1 Tax=Comamonas endophytica TaxID=2949090 RepID=UPI002987FEA2|nr:glutathione S-transferase C-terminal domain-containing protein [Acidovorax sp. 5MLIR]
MLAAFELKTRASLEVLEGEVQALEASDFGIGHLTLVCALGYIDYRFGDLGWRGQAPQLAAWFVRMQQRPSVMATEPVDG